MRGMGRGCEAVRVTSEDGEERRRGAALWRVPSTILRALPADVLLAAFGVLAAGAGAPRSAWSFPPPLSAPLSGYGSLARPNSMSLSFDRAPRSHR